MSRAKEPMTLTLAEAAAWLGITTSLVDTMLRTNTFPERTFRLGSRTFIIKAIWNATWPHWWRRRESPEPNSTAAYELGR